MEPKDTLEPKDPHGRAHFPCGRTRREFVWEMGAGFVGTALTALLAEDGFFARHAAAATS